jgi:hypothetical protein
MCGGEIGGRGNTGLSRDILLMAQWLTEVEQVVHLAVL